MLALSSTQPLKNKRPDTAYSSRQWPRYTDLYDCRHRVGAPDRRRRRSAAGLLAWEQGWGVWTSHGDYDLL